MKRAGNAAGGHASAKLGLALQGGGSYGAYTKGVLKALFNSKTFNSPSVEIKAVTGTSAVAVNGALVTCGLNTGGPAQAVRLLDKFWHEVGATSQVGNFLFFFDPFRMHWPNLPEFALKVTAGMIPKGFVTGQLKKMLEHHVTDWNALRNGPVRLFVNALQEDPGTGKRRHIVFKAGDLNADTVAASGALREFGAHEINGRRFFDGAYWRNPCMSDIKKEDITDLLVITLHAPPPGPVQPVHQDAARDKHPDPGSETIRGEIHNHLAHIRQAHPHINLHVISLKISDRWNQTSRLNTDPQWLAKLEETGYQDGIQWLKENAVHLGRKSTYDAPRP